MGNSGYNQQRWKKGWSMGALLPDGNGQYHSCQKDLGQVYRTWCEFYKNGYLSRLFAVGPMKNRFPVSFNFPSRPKTYS